MNKEPDTIRVGIAPLCRHRDQIETLAAGYLAQWPGWYGPLGPGDAGADLAARAQDHGLPFGLVAIVDGQAVGATAFAAGVYTQPSPPAARACGPMGGARLPSARRRGGLDRGLAILMRRAWAMIGYMPGRRAPSACWSAMVGP